MYIEKKWFIAAGIALTIIMGGLGGIFFGRSSAVALADSAAVTVNVDGQISYQGRLRTAQGTPVNGSVTMRFILYNAAVGGSALWDSGNVAVTVNGGLFNQILNIDQADFNGQGVWLAIIVEGETLSPRQPILPAPYALSLRPGADISGDPVDIQNGVADFSLPNNVSGNRATQRAGGFLAPATGFAVFGDASGGTGIFGDSENSYGVHGSSNNSWGGYFSSDNGYGIRVETSGTDHYDHGALISSSGGYGVLAQSSNNMAVRGEAGSITGASLPLGRVGVAGIGQNRGVHGSSSSGLGVYGTSVTSTGVWGNTSRGDQNYGLYTNDNLFAGNLTSNGPILQVAQNGGSQPLTPGAIVVFSGMTAWSDGSPIPQVSTTTQANSTAVAGVVYSRYNVEAVEALNAEISEGRVLDQMETLERRPRRG